MCASVHHRRRERGRVVVDVEIDQSIGRINPLPDRDQPCRPLTQGLGRGSNATFALPVSSFRECAAPFAARTFPRIPAHITCAQYGSLPIPDRSLPAPDSPAFPGAAHALTGGPVDGGPSEPVLASAFPLTCARIRSISAGSSMLAMTCRDALMPRAHGCAGAATRTALPQRTQLSTSIPKTRLSRLAHVIAACRSIADFSV
jgi:hypothetical protein